MAKSNRVQGLDCSASAEKMIRLVLSAQLNAMCKHRKKALDWKDPEGVHDMRVLSRRLRSSMSDFKPYLRKAIFPRVKLSKLADSLGDVRDEDVALAALEELKVRARDVAAEGIEMLADESRKRRKQARAALESGIRKPVVDDFRKQFRDGLRTVTLIVPKKGRRKKAATPALTFKSVGVEIIKARLKEFSTASSHLYFPFEIKELHELRILAKRLRYAVELFATCWGEDLEAIAKEIALLQTSLGELHDCDVWIDSLGTRLRQTARKRNADKDDLKLREGAAWLLKHFARERIEHYRDALARWQQWQADGFLADVVLVLDRELLPENPQQKFTSN